MDDKKKPDAPGKDRPKLVGGPVPIPVEVDPVAYGIGHEVHYERDPEKEQ